MLLYPLCSPPPATPGFCPPVKFCGMIRETLAMSGMPCSSNPRRVITTTGEGPVAPRMRVPVTVISVSPGFSWLAWEAARTTSAPASSSTTRPLPLMARRTAWSTVKLPRSAGARRPRTSESANRISRPLWRAMARNVLASSCDGNSNASGDTCALAGRMTTSVWTAVAASSAAQKVFVEIAILFPPRRRLCPALRGLTERSANYGVGREKIALRMTSHVFVRPGELRRAEWSEFGLERAVGSIPAEKMKVRWAASGAAIAPSARPARRGPPADRAQSQCVRGDAYLEVSHVGVHRDLCAPAHGIQRQRDDRAWLPRDAARCALM